MQETENTFADLFSALDLKERRKAMRTATRRVGAEARATAAGEIAASGLGHGTRRAIAKSLRLRVYPARYGLGFMITTKPHGKEGYHKNRQGKEKPILMWAQEGTQSRTTRGTRSRSRHATGSMPAYRFLQRAEERATRHVEAALFAELKTDLDKALRKKQLL